VLLSCCECDGGDLLSHLLLPINGNVVGQLEAEVFGAGRDDVSESGELKGRPQQASGVVLFSSSYLSVLVLVLVSPSTPML
jgi:hypothetical protein